MNEVTKRVRFLVLGEDINTHAEYKVGTEVELTRTQEVFDYLVNEGIVEIVSDSPSEE